jgi:hypothetical protein
LRALRDVERDVLFFEACRPHSARVLATVAWVEHHARDAAVPLGAEAGRAPRHVDDDAKRFLQVEDAAVSRPAVEIKHDTRARRLWEHANARDDAAADGVAWKTTRSGAERDAVDVDEDALSRTTGCGLVGHAEAGFARERNHDTCGVLARPMLDAIDERAVSCRPPHPTPRALAPRGRDRWP